MAAYTDAAASPYTPTDYFLLDYTCFWNVEFEIEILKIESLKIENFEMKFKFENFELRFWKLDFEIKELSFINLRLGNLSF